MTPDLSVLMPILNAEEGFLIEALNSVVAQDFENWELIIVEAPSDHLSKAIVRKFNDSRIKYHLQSTRTTLVDQLNFGLHQANADIVARLDADDVCEKNRFSSQMAFLNQNSDIDVVGSQLSIIDENSNIYANRDYPTDPAEVGNLMMIRNSIAHPAATFRRESVLTLGGYDANYAKGGEDYDLWVRMLKNGSRLANLPERLLRYRHHPNQVKIRQLKQQLKGTIAVKEMHFRNEMNTRAKLRLWSEKFLMYVPGFLVGRLFQLLHLRKIQ